MFLFIFIAVLLSYLFGAAFLFKVFAVSLAILFAIPFVLFGTIFSIMLFVSLLS